MHTARGASRIFGFVRWQGHHLTLAQEPRHPQLFDVIRPLRDASAPAALLRCILRILLSSRSLTDWLGVWRFSISKVSEREKCTPVAHPFALLLSHVSLISSSALCASNAPAAGCFVRRAESKGLNFLSLSLLRRKCISDTCWLDLTAVESVIRLSLSCVASFVFPFIWNMGFDLFLSRAQISNVDRVKYNNMHPVLMHLLMKKLCHGLKVKRFGSSAAI